MRVSFRIDIEPRGQGRVRIGQAGNFARAYKAKVDVENEGTHVVNDAGKLWVLGYKTERGGTLLKTNRGGSSEILGGFSYTTTAGKLAPMFVTDNSSVFTFFGEVCYSRDPFATLIRETRQGATRSVARGAGTTTPYRSIPASHRVPERTMKIRH